MECNELFYSILIPSCKLSRYFHCCSVAAEHLLSWSSTHLESWSRYVCTLTYLLRLVGLSPSVGPQTPPSQRGGTNSTNSDPPARRTMTTPTAYASPRGPDDAAFRLPEPRPSSRSRDSETVAGRRRSYDYGPSSIIMHSSSAPSKHESMSQPGTERSPDPAKTKEGVILLFVSAFLFSLMGMFLQLEGLASHLTRWSS